MDENKTLLLKDELFNKDVVQGIADCITAVYSSFDASSFIDKTLCGFASRELKERMSWMREKLEDYLPFDYKTTVNILLESIKHSDKLGGFAFSSYADYVMVNGCTAEYADLSLDAIGEITKYFSGEFAIRIYINEFPQKTFEKMQTWSKSQNLHQRRLASEGLRPKLPWSKKITFDYKQGASILDNLYYDNERYVTRSVANHLNDISKIDADYVIKILNRWKQSNRQNENEMNYIINHSLRTSIKRGHINTFEFLGYKQYPKVMISDFKIKQSQLKLGDYLEFSFDINALGNENLIIDYKIIYPMKNNKISQKVFKIRKVELNDGECITIHKRQRFAGMTTKKLYSGDYKLIIQINGQEYNTLDFKLNVT